MFDPLPPPPPKNAKLCRIVPPKSPTIPKPALSSASFATVCPKQVQARILPSPRLEYGGNSHIDPGPSGFWDLRNQRLFQPATLDSAALVCFVPPDQLRTQDGKDVLAEFKKVRGEGGKCWRS